MRKLIVIGAPGPPGAVVGEVGGAIVGGPRIGGERACWRDRHNRKHCRWR